MNERVLAFLDRRRFLDYRIPGDEINKGLGKTVNVARPDCPGMLDHLKIISRLDGELPR